MTVAASTTELLAREIQRFEHVHPRADVDAHTAVCDEEAARELAQAS